VTVSAAVVVVVLGLWIDPLWMLWMRYADVHYADFRKLGMFTGSGAIEGGINESWSIALSS
jgi:hypothetical protein